MGNPYVLATISSPENLARLDRLVEINRRLADPRGLSEAEAKRLAQEGRAFYFLYGTIHSTEVGNTQAIIEIAHRLATDRQRRDQADPRQPRRPDRPVAESRRPGPGHRSLVQDEGHAVQRGSIPDLYHKYTGHDDNRDWFMFTQKETRLAVEKIQNVYKPHHHARHAPAGLRPMRGSSCRRSTIPYDPNVHPILAQEHIAVGQAMASALVSEGKGGVEWPTRATTCGRRRGSTWSITASRAS